MLFRSHVQQDEYNFEIFPDTRRLIFQMQDTYQKTLYNQQLKLKNKSNSQIFRFKIRSTSPFNYIVKPAEANLMPMKSLQISMKMIMADRDLEKFRSDKFEVMFKEIRKEQENREFDKEFWKGATRVQISIDIQMKQQEKTLKNYEQNLKPTEEEIQNLEKQCFELEQKIKRLKETNTSAGILEKKNLIIAGVISFLLGFIFT